MKATQAFTFIKNRKDITLSRQAFAAFVETKDKDLVAELASLPQLNITNDSANKYVTFLTKVINKSQQKIKEKLFYLTSYLLNVRKDDSALLNEFFKNFKALEETSFFKVKMATVLFKSVENKQFKKDVLLESIKLLSKQVKLTNLISLLQSIDPILSELEFSESELASIYELSIVSLENAPLYKNLTIHLILKLLKLPLQKLDATIVQKSLVFLIQNASINEQIVELAESTKNNTLAFTLFKLLISGDLEAYKTLQTSKSTQIKNLNFNIEDYERKLKINSIAKLASQSKTLKYSEIAQKLTIPIQQVQNYIISAIQSNIISARIDEIDEIITIQDIKSKYFTQDQWTSILTGIQSLQGKLSKYVSVQ